MDLDRTYEAPLGVMQPVPTTAWSSGISDSTIALVANGSQKFYLPPMTIVGTDANANTLTIDFNTDGNTTSIDYTVQELGGFGLTDGHLFQLALTINVNGVISEFHEVGSAFNTVINTRHSGFTIPNPPATIEYSCRVDESSPDFQYLPSFGRLYKNNAAVPAYWEYNGAIGSNFGEVASPYLLSYIGGFHGQGAFDFGNLTLVEKSSKAPYLVGTGSITQQVNEYAVLCSTGDIFRNPGGSVNDYTEPFATRGNITANLYSTHWNTGTIAFSEQMWAIGDAYDADSATTAANALDQITVTANSVLIIPHYADYLTVTEAYTREAVAFTSILAGERIGVPPLADPPATNTVYVMQIADSGGGATNDAHVNNVIFNAAHFEYIVSSALHPSILGYSFAKVNRTPATLTMPVIFGSNLVGDGSKFSEFLETYVNGAISYSDMPSYTTDANIAKSNFEWRTAVDGFAPNNAVTTGNAGTYASDAIGRIPPQWCYGPAMSMPLAISDEGFTFTLWCEAPLVGNGVTLADYWTRMIQFIQKRSVSRVIIRLEDPGTEDSYKLSTTGPSGVNDEYGQFLHRFLIDSYVQGSSLEIWVLPYMGGPIQWGTPLDGTFTPTTSPAIDYPGLYDTTLLNAEQTVIWVQWANEYIQNIASGTNFIKGICYEEEGNHPGTTANAVCTGFKNAFGDTSLFTAPSPTWSQTPSSAFQFALTRTPTVNYNTEADFNQGFTDAYINHLVPEYYNLFKLVSGTNRVDAYDPDNPPSNPSPLYPASIYTNSSGGVSSPSSGQSLALSKLFGSSFLGYIPSMVFAAGRANSVSPMFSTEVAGLVDHANPFANGGLSVTGLTLYPGVGEINAFGSQASDGSPIWSWDQFQEFARIFMSDFSRINGANQTERRVGIFQFNLIPASWLPA